jgi:hypothetical protein
MRLAWADAGLEEPSRYRASSGWSGSGNPGVLRQEGDRGVVHHRSSSAWSNAGEQRAPSGLLLNRRTKKLRQLQERVLTPGSALVVCHRAESILKLERFPLANAAAHEVERVCDMV